MQSVYTRKGLEEFGLFPEEINNARDGMFLAKGIEDAFDKQQVCFLYNVLQSSPILWVAYRAILSATIIGSSKKFSDVHQKLLLCPHDHLPYRRLLSWHARLTLELQYDHRPKASTDRNQRSNMQSGSIVFDIKSFDASGSCCRCVMPSFVGLSHFRCSINNSSGF